MEFSPHQVALLDRARDLAAREGGLAVVVTLRPDGTAHASVVNAGIVEHPVTRRRAVGFVVQGRARAKLANLRARPVTTVVFRSGWDWVTIDGDVDLVGPDDRLEGVRPESVANVFHEIYAAGIGSAADEWATRDDVIERERHTAVLVRPIRVYSNPTA
ncbi:MAG: pyridoxamine 5'-phosphate oxidase family protein [Acidimicrobiia bacterium]